MRNSELAREFDLSTPFPQFELKPVSFSIKKVGRLIEFLLPKESFYRMKHCPRPGPQLDRAKMPEHCADDLDSIKTAPNLDAFGRKDAILSLEFAYDVRIHLDTYCSAFAETRCPWQLDRVRYSTLSTPTPYEDLLSYTMAPHFLADRKPRLRHQVTSAYKIVTAVREHHTRSAEQIAPSDLVDQGNRESSSKPLH
ncbi:MAG: hypothetical protein ACLQAT_06045 [Candidatus Binataceae bacterium]